MNTLLPVIGAAALCLVAVCIWRALSNARTPQGAVAWVIFLLAAPWFAVPAYAIFGNHRAAGYTRARRHSRQVTDSLGDLARAHPPAEDARAPLEVFEQIVGMPAMGGNGARLLIDGAATFEAIFAALDGARTYACVQFYTIADDATGRALADRLIAAAHRGVTVWLIFDGVGSYGLPRRYRQRLSEAGVRVVDPRAARGPTSYTTVNFRNHRKTVIVDGRLAYFGGLNVADVYIHGSKRLGHWRDTHVEVRGPLVAQLQRVYIEDWHWATGESLKGELTWDPGTDPADMTALVAPTGPSDAAESGTRVFFAAVSKARERLWIASPYFVPDASVAAALANAALRGCDVRVMLTGTVDHWLPWLAAFAYFDDIRAAGVKVYRYTPGFLHQKVVLVDDTLVAIGTMNLDMRSFCLNFETMAIFHDRPFAAEVAAMLRDDLANCHPEDRDLAQQPLPVRIGAPLARLLAPVL